MIISFGWTSLYLPPNGSKNVTRRCWKPRTLKAWQKAWDEGRLTHTAVNKLLYKGGDCIGTITLTARPYLERLSDMPPEDVVNEGGMVATVDEFIAKYFDGDRDRVVAVVRFRFVPQDVPPMVWIGGRRVRAEIDEGASFSDDGPPHPF